MEYLLEKKARRAIKDTRSYPYASWLMSSLPDVSAYLPLCCFYVYYLYIDAASGKKNSECIIIQKTDVFCLMRMDVLGSIVYTFFLSFVGFEFRFTL